MQQEFSDSSFIYSGQKYTLEVALFNNSENFKQFHALNNENIESLEIINQANCLYLTGEMIYVDSYGVVDKYYEKQFTWLAVQFGEVQMQKTENVDSSKLDPENFFSIDFYVTSIELLNRNHHVLTYKISFVSSNWFKAIANISYSNYSKRPETLFDLIKVALSLNDLQVDDKSFDEVKTDVKINYITNGNENSISMVKYLLSKMYYYDTRDESLKFIYYNYLTKKYHLFDMANSDTSRGMYNLIISFFNTQNEQYLEEEPINLGTVTQFPKNMTFLDMFNYGFFGYDYQHNVFLDKSVKSEDIINYRNKRFENTSYKNKFEFIFDSTLKYYNWGSYWNNDTLSEVYYHTMKTMTEDNAIVVNCSGVLTRLPGDFVNVNVDRRLDYTKTEEPIDLDDVKKRYKAFEGSWVISKIRHIIQPKAKKYRQNLVLFRNYTTDATEKDAK